LAQTRGLLRHFDLRARKRLGQHFLIDEEVLKLITSTAELTPSDVIVEIGAGLGVLTKELAKEAGWVVTIELDSKLAALLGQTLASFKNVAIINEDVLKIDPGTLLQEQKEWLPPAITPSRYKVVANLPYYITSAILRHLLEARRKPSLLVVTVQREVAQRLTARPGEMSLLAVAVQFYGRPRIVSHVQPGAFYPSPRVTSAIVRIDLYEEPPTSVDDVGKFFDVVRAGFAQRRKQLRNSLSQGLDLPAEAVVEALRRCGLDERQRAQALTLEQWGRLYRELRAQSA